MHTSGCSKGRQSDGEFVAGGGVGRGAGAVEDSGLVGPEGGSVVGPVVGAVVGAVVGRVVGAVVGPVVGPVVGADAPGSDDREPEGPESDVPGSGDPGAGHIDSGHIESGDPESGAPECGDPGVPGSVTGGDAASCGVVAGAPPEWLPAGGCAPSRRADVPGGTERACVRCSRECDSDREVEVFLSWPAVRDSTWRRPSGVVALESGFEKVRGGGSMLASL